MTEKELRAHLPMSFTTNRTKRYTSKTYPASDDELCEITRLFEKKFSFTNNSIKWNLPEVEVMFESDLWKVIELESIKKELNEVKSTLNDFDLEDWHRHTKLTNKAGDILWKLRNEFEPEFVTQAWCKFYEIVMSFPLVPQKIDKLQCFNSVHLCEAPGAFITSLNHYLKLHYPGVNWNWKASTLNPYYEGNSLTSMINDDRFIFQTLPYWTFGCDYTGDVMNLNNIKHIVEEVKQMGEVLLVTADGSVDCHENPAEQECVVSTLHYYETITALNILGVGGTFLLKIFTTYEAQTICLLYLLCCAFCQVKFFKPATSKEGNSEVYVICLEYKGREILDPWLRKLEDFTDPVLRSKVMFPLEDIPKDFIEELLSCSEMYKDFQVEAIKKNVQLLGECSNNYCIKQYKYLAVQYFVKHYRLKRLSDESKEVVGKHRLKEMTFLNLDSHFKKGSFSDRMQKKNSEIKKLLELQEELLLLDVSWTCKSDIKWLKMQSSQLEFNIITGKPVNIVHSSKFCSKHILKIWSDVRDVTAQLSESSCSDKCLAHEMYDKCNSKRLLHVLKDIDSSLSINLNIVNIKNGYWCSLNGNANELAEKKAFFDILKTINKLQKGENLLLSGYPLLTQFNVGIIYLLSSLFEKIGFMNPIKHGYGIVFVGFHSSSVAVLNFLNNVKEMCTQNTEIRERSVLAVVTITKLCGKMENSISQKNCFLEPKRKCITNVHEIEELETGVTFCQCVTEMNNVFMKEQMSMLISDLIPKR